MKTDWFYTNKDMKKVLVTGACGFIGSHTVIDLIENGFEVISIDNFSNSYPEVLESLKTISNKTIQNYNIDLCDFNALKQVFEENKDIDGVIHFAALKVVGESVNEPLKYYKNNIEGLLNLLSCCKEYKVKDFVFSSSCSVYGNAETLPVDENTALCVSESPYAETKAMAERILSDFTKVTPFKTALLRYFNPIGAHESGLIGENPKGIPENIIPRITGTVLGKFESFKIYGTDYPTKDGTCVRDYIHVSDIAHGHTLALNWLSKQKDSTCEIFNMGSGNGVSVLEMVQAFEKGTGEKLNYVFENRRAGDVEAIYANNDKAKTVLGWTPKHTLITMMKSAWDWSLKLE